MNDSVRIVEVGPRDGLQNEGAFVPTELKVQFVEKLAVSGLSEIEVTSFVSPKWVPQLADAEQLSTGIDLRPTYSALVPNLKGMQRAKECGYERIALFTAASESFCRRNINMGLAESLDRFREVIGQYRTRPERWVRAYVSTAFECPYEGVISPEVVVNVTGQLFEMGVDEVSLGDTIGVAGPAEVGKLGRLISNNFDDSRVAFHFHDTRGTAVANVSEALRLGFRIFDSSAGGLGGCPYAPGAGGNLATEDLVYFLRREGAAVDVDLAALSEASLEILAFLGRRPTAKAQLASLAEPDEEIA
jgi:hydroxymethylglutaryl-CoA lyase